MVPSADGFMGRDVADHEPVNSSSGHAAAAGRRSVITPTAAGLRRMDAVRTARAESLADLLGDWTEEEPRTLGTMFVKYNGSVARTFLAEAAAPAAR